MSISTILMSTATSIEAPVMKATTLAAVFQNHLSCPRVTRNCEQQPQEHLE